MRAAVYERYGSPTVLEVKDVSPPSCGEDAVLVKVRASTVNRTDCGFLRGKPLIVRFFSGLMKPKNPILGSEFAGDVVEVGDEVTGYSPGDRVFGFKDDDFGFGGLAEFTAMSVRGMLDKIPEGISYSEAAASTEGAHYALHYLRAAKVATGQNVLVNGATGAIGSSAVQILAHLGAEVTAVCDTANIRLVESLGAQRIIDYTQEDFTAVDQLFDFVFDAVGKSTFGKCRRILKDRGIYASTELGPWAQNPFLALWSNWFGKQKVQFPMPTNKREDIEYLSDMMRGGFYKPVIDRHYPLEQIREAYQYVETGMKTGNVVILVDAAEAATDERLVRSDEAWKLHSKSSL